ncbi:MAG: hypothetical protein FJW79_00225 [Actinobacteria bacterium]|nr:hypothetical protein [Actinomycetota bacterium]
MARPIWKQLLAEDLEAFRAYLVGLPAEERPRYGLLGVKASWWSRLGGGARPFVALLVGDRVILSKRSFRAGREMTRHEYPAADLKAIKVRRGPLLESARLRFADGYALRLGSLPRRQTQPWERLLAGEEDALDPAGLSPEQLTNFCQAAAALGLGPDAPGAEAAETEAAEAEAAETAAAQS